MNVCDHCGEHVELEVRPAHPGGTVPATVRWTHVPPDGLDRWTCPDLTGPAQSHESMA